MCGLFGIIDTAHAIDLERARHARDVLTHRGPDQAGEWYANPGVYMGHRRLSIIDTSAAGRQPMVHGEVAVTVNGEIYNFQALRRELELAGFQFTSGSDSEVVLHGYRCWGIDGLVSRLEGMYAAVVYDGARQRVFAFRDRVGIKPLYYFASQGRLVWASELKAIQAYLPARDLSVDNQALLDFLVYRYIPAPRSVYSQVSKLSPASVLEFQITDGTWRVYRYWRLPTDVSKSPDQHLGEQLRDILDRSVASQLISDVPLGLLLSGGLDSSAVAAAAARHTPHIRSYSIGFKQPGRDETPVAARMAEHAGTSHHIQYFDDDDMHDVSRRMLAWFDEPFADTSAVPSFRVSEFARQSVTVALSGDGGDELFGGYHWYLRYASVRAWRRLWPGSRPRYGMQWPANLPWRNLAHWVSIGDPLWLYASIRGSVPYPRLTQWRELLEVPADYDPLWAYRNAFDPTLTARRAAQVMDFHTYLPDDILTKVDRASMAVSLECRPALLSTELIEFAARLPDSFLYAGGELKGGFRAALACGLPAEVISHAKQGFSVPDSGWRRTLKGPFDSVQEGMLQPFIDGHAGP